MSDQTQRDPTFTDARAQLGAEVRAERLRGAVQRFVRTFGLLSSDQTPCGQPLSTSHAHALMFLLSQEGAPTPVTQRALGEALGVDKSNVARACARMERVGHVSQRRSPADGRARVIELTSQGRRLAAGVEAASRARFAAVFDAVPDGERDRLLDALETLNDAVARVARNRPTPREEHRE